MHLILIMQSGKPEKPDIFSAWGGAYEFAELNCFPCSNSESCDPYQVGDWYQ